MWCPIHDFAERFAFYRQTTASSARATYSDSCGTVCRNDIDLVCRLTTNQNAFPPGPFGGERRPRESTQESPLRRVFSLLLSTEETSSTLGRKTAYLEAGTTWGAVCMFICLCFLYRFLDNSR